MSGLVGYGSSDEEEEDDELQPEKPAKVGHLHLRYYSRMFLAGRREEVRKEGDEDAYSPARPAA